MKAVRQAADDAPSEPRTAVFAAAFEREAQRVELRRALFTAIVLGGLVLAVALLRAVPSLYPEGLRVELQRGFWLIVLLLLAVLGYEVSLFFWLRRAIRQSQPASPEHRYVTVMVECSLPTAIILVNAAVQGPLAALVGAAPLGYFLFIFLAVLNLDFRLCAVAGVVSAVECTFVCLILLNLVRPEAGQALVGPALLYSPHQYVIKGVLLLFGGVLAGFVARWVRQQIMVALRSVEDRDRAISIFGQHVSPQVAEMLLRQPIEAAGEERNVCVMFLDIRDFSRIAAERQPAEVMEYLNVLFGFMIGVVNEHRGIVNKFLGDGFMAVFGAPIDDGEQCAHALGAASSILARVDALNEQGAIPPTRIGIGLHMGRAVTGNVGSSERKEYTVIGDVVNVAARIEQATKQFQARLLVSDAVWSVVKPPPAGAEDLGPVELKGQPHPVRLWKLA